MATAAACALLDLECAAWNGGNDPTARVVHHEKTHHFGNLLQKCYRADIAIEHGHVLIDLAMKRMMFYSYVNVYQRLRHVLICLG